MTYYNFKDNELLNFFDINFYLYDIEGYKHYQEDIFLFYEYRDNELLDFKINELSINEKIEFQKNYTMLYFHYVIQLFKNFKVYQFNIAIESILLNDNFIYDNFDNTMTEKRKDFLYHLESFLKLFKTIVISKNGTIVRFINSVILHYNMFTDFNNDFKYELLYDSLILEKCNKNDLYLMESRLDHLMEILIYILDKLNDLRKFHVDCINLLKLEKLIEFFEFPMFSKLKGFILLKEAYFYCLEELVIEERAFDHIYNITMCIFRVFKKHNMFFKQEVLYKNGIMTKLVSLELED